MTNEEEIDAYSISLYDKSVLKSQFKDHGILISEEDNIKYQWTDGIFRSDKKYTKEEVKEICLKRGWDVSRFSIIPESEERIETERDKTVTKENMYKDMKEIFIVTCRALSMDRNKLWECGQRFLEDYFNMDYGKLEIGRETITVVTGGWSDNEYVIEILKQSEFWNVFRITCFKGGRYVFRREQV